MARIRRTVDQRSADRKAMRKEGLLARFSPIKGVTPKTALDQSIWLPAWLNTMTVSETALHNEYDTITDGHFSMGAQGDASARQFRTTSADTITVDYGSSFLPVTDQRPGWLRDRFYEILRSRKPVRLLVSFHPAMGRDAELDMYCTFREIDKDVRPGENEARYLTITISEWRDPSTERRSSAGGLSRAPGITLPTTVAIDTTDTLSSLSMEFYGRYDGWRYIRDANGIPKAFGQKTAIASLPGRFAAGTKLKIPLIASAGLSSPGAFGALGPTQVANGG